MEIILLLIRIFLFAVFAVAGIGKLLDLEGAKKAVVEFGTPEEFAKTFAIALPFAEIVFAVCFLFVGTAWVGALGALILLLSFIGGMIFHLAQGTAPECHCFGALHSEPVSKKGLLRNIVFALLALFLLAQGRANQGLSPADLTNETALQMVLGLVIIGFLGAIVFYLKKISEQQNQIMRRLEILEVASHEGSETKRENLADPHEGLPIGAPVPDFAASDLNNREIAFEHLLTAGKPLLFFFVSPNCGPCGALLPEIETWQSALKDKIDFVFVSSGDARENAEKLGGAGVKRILLQKNREVAEVFNALWTPTAVLINADGTAAGRPAAGDAAIRELIEKIKAEQIADGMIYVTNGDAAYKIGKAVPTFAARDAAGEKFSSRELTGRKTLLTYWSLDCGWCARMLDDLREWDAARGADEPDLLLVSSGDAQRNRELGLRGKILLDDQLAVSKKLGMNGTPSAVLIDEAGRIVSEVAVGAQSIWALIGKRK